jgi:hypothetical protein
MSQPPFVKELTDAARRVARLEVKLRKLTAVTTATADDLREARRQLKLLAAATEPYTPPSAAETRERIDGAEPLT